MKSDLEKSKEIFKNGDYTCVLCKDEITYTSTERGLKPLITWLENGTDLTGVSASDKIVGKAAAMVYSLLKVDSVYAPVMSEDGAKTLEKSGITPLYDTLVKEIRNRLNTGLCPMEETVKNISEPKKALAAIKQKIKQMMSHN